MGDNIMKKSVFLLCIFLVATLVAQAQEDAAALNAMLQQGSRAVTVGELLLEETFDNPNAWENYEDENSYLRVQNGVYHTYRSEYNNTLWGQNSAVHTDVVMQVETRQLSPELNNAYGIMCRASPENNSDGYYLRISGDGYSNIAVRANGETQHIAEWTPNLNMDQPYLTHTITAVCVDDYFAVYFDGELVAEATDETFSSGVAGFAITSFVEGQPIEVEFDNLRIWSASTSGSSNQPPPATVAPLPTTEGGDSGKGGNTELDLTSLALPIDIVSMVERFTPSITIERVLDRVTFDAAEDWRAAEDAETTSILQVDADQGVYYISTGPLNGLNFWTTNTTTHRDVVITAETEQLSPELNNGYGLGCRVDEDSGYFFRISGDGYYSITRYGNNSFTSLVDWAQSDAIHQGQAQNEITIVCVSDYLALYANGQLLAETNDSLLTEGNAAILAAGYDNTPISVTFDNVVIMAASSK